MIPSSSDVELNCTHLKCYEYPKCKIKDIANHCSRHRDYLKEEIMSKHSIRDTDIPDQIIDAVHNSCVSMKEVKELAESGSEGVKRWMEENVHEFDDVSINDVDCYTTARFTELHYEEVFELIEHYASDE